MTDTAELRRWSAEDLMQLRYEAGDCYRNGKITGIVDTAREKRKN